METKDSDGERIKVESNISYSCLKWKLTWNSIQKIVMEEKEILI